MSIEDATLVDRIGLVIEAQKIWGEPVARSLAEQLGVNFLDTVGDEASPRGGQRGWPKFQLRLPPDLKRYIAEKAALEGGSQNSMIVRAVRDSMRAEAEA